MKKLRQNPNLREFPNKLKPIRAAIKAPKPKELDKFPLKTFKVPIGKFTTENWSVIPNCMVEMQVIWDPNLPVIIVSPALTWWARIYDPEVESQWWWWWNNMVWKWKTFDPTKNCIICCSNIWWAEWSTWPFHLWTTFPVIKIEDITKANTIALLRLNKEWYASWWIRPWILSNWIEAVAWISLWWTISISLAETLIKKWIKVERLIPIESTSNPTPFVLATWEIYETICKLIPEIILRHWNKRRFLKNSLDEEIIWQITSLISSLRAKIWRLLSVNPAEFSKAFKNDPKKWRKFVRWEVALPAQYKDNYLKLPEHSNYREAADFIDSQLWELSQTFETMRPKAVLETLLSIARQFWFLLFLSPKEFQTKEYLCSETKNSQKNLKTYLKKQWIEFVQRFTLKALENLLIARDDFKTTKERIKFLQKNWVKVTYIANKEDTYYDKDSIDQSAKEFNAEILYFSNTKWHDWAFDKNEHDPANDEKNPTLYDQFNKALAA